MVFNAYGVEGEVQLLRSMETAAKRVLVGHGDTGMERGSTIRNGLGVVHLAHPTSLVREVLR